MEIFLIIILLLIVYSLWSIGRKLDELEKLGRIFDKLGELDRIVTHLDNISITGVNTTSDSDTLVRDGIDNVIKKLDKISDHLDDISMKLDK